MINLRKGFFETNSSSGDSYDDDRTNEYVKFEQNLEIVLTYESDTDDDVDKLENFQDWVYDEEKCPLAYDLRDMFEQFFPNRIEQADEYITEVGWSVIYVCFPFLADCHYDDRWHDAYVDEIAIPTDNLPDKENICKKILAILNKNEFGVRVTKVDIIVKEPDWFFNEDDIIF